MTNPSETDPWEDARAERGPERDNPLESEASGAFGASPETVGAPRMTSGTGRPGTAGMSRGALVAIAVVLLVIVVSGAYVWLF